MKRVSVLVFVFGMILCLCACGEAEAEPVPVPTEAPVQAVEEAPTEAPTIPTAPEEKTYTLTIIDVFDTPVCGASVKIDNIVCVTDEFGVATFKLVPGEYKAIIQELPFGYSLGEQSPEVIFEEGVTYLTIYVNSTDAEIEDVYMEDLEDITDIDTPDDSIPEEDDYAPEE